MSICQGMQEGMLWLLLMALGSSQRLTAAEAQALLFVPLKVCVPPIVHIS